MFAYGVTAGDAFALLRSVSQDRNIKVRQIAARLTANLPGAFGRTGSARVPARVMDDLLSQAASSSEALVEADHAAGSGSGGGDVEEQGSDDDNRHRINVVVTEAPHRTEVNMGGAEPAGTGDDGYLDDAQRRRYPGRINGG
jgi:hypothetical protein